MSGSSVGRLVVDVQTNKSGGAVAYGDVVINDTANDHAFTTTTSGAFTAGAVGVCIEPNGIPNNEAGRIQYQGYCAQINAAASVTRGYFLTTHTVAKQATSASTRVVGSFGVALKTSATPDAILWGLPDASSATGNMATDALWDVAGDLAVGTGANAAHRLAAGTSGYLLKSAGAADPVWALAPVFHGCRVHHSGTQTVASGVTAPLLCDTEDYDTDGYHFTSGAALTGTVTKASASPNIVGSGTSFTTELSVNQVISIPGTATEIGVVKTITDNTNLVLWQNMANNASGQTATRRNEFMAVPVGFAGKYRIAGGFRWTTVTTAKVSACLVGINGSLTASGTVVATNSTQSVTSSVNFLSAEGPYALAEGDYVGVYMQQNESGTVTIASAPYSPFVAISLIGV